MTVIPRVPAERPSWSSACGALVLVLTGASCGAAPDAPPVVAPAPAAPAPADLRPPEAFAGVADPGARAEALFLEASRVLLDPRCTNCHPTDDGVLRAGEGELSQGVLDWPLAIPSVRAEVGEAPAHLRIGWMRSVCNIHHAFAISSFIDEIAHARGADPRDVLLELIGPPRVVTPADLGVDKLPNYGQPLDQHPVDTARLRRVVERVTALAGWEGRKAAGRSLGLAAHRSFLTYVAVVVSATLDARGKVHVAEAWVAVDAGTILNADRVRAQMEGAVVFGMSLALRSAITARDGAVEQTNFRDYPVVRTGEAPRAIHVDIVPSEGPPGGVGEPGVPPVAPAVANAVFALTGKRVRDLPLARAGLA